MSDLFKQARAISTVLYMNWLEYHKVISELKQPTTIASLYYTKKWKQSSQKPFELILSFLSSMNILESAGGTFVLTDNYTMIVNKIKKSHNFDLLKNDPQYMYIKYALDLFDDTLEGGSGIWNRKNYYIMESFYGSDLFRYIVISLSEHIAELVGMDTIKNITVLSLYSDLIINTLPQLDISPENIVITTFSEKLKRLARTSCELSNETSIYSERIKVYDEEVHKSDLYIILNGLGFHLTLKELAEIIDKNSNNISRIVGITTLSEKGRIGIEPLLYFQPNFREYGDCKKLEKSMKSVGFENYLYYDKDHWHIFCMNR